MLAVLWLAPLGLWSTVDGGRAFSDQPVWLGPWLNFGWIPCAAVASIAGVAASMAGLFPAVRRAVAIRLSLIPLRIMVAVVGATVAYVWTDLLRREHSWKRSEADCRELKPGGLSAFVSRRWTEVGGPENVDDCLAHGKIDRLYVSGVLGTADRAALDWIVSQSIMLPRRPGQDAIPVRAAFLIGAVEDLKPGGVRDLLRRTDALGIYPFDGSDFTGGSVSHLDSERALAKLRENGRIRAEDLSALEAAIRSAKASRFTSEVLAQSPEFSRALAIIAAERARPQ